MNDPERSMERTPRGQRFRVVKGVPEGDELAVLAVALDLLAATDREPGPWTTAVRPGIGLRAYPAGGRFAASVRSRWGTEP